jgi:hypothetical protein
MKQRRKTRELFNHWEWLKNSSGHEYSYTRVIGAVCLLIFQPLELTYIYLNRDIIEIDNFVQFLVIGLPTIAATILFGFETIKENKAISFKIGDKEYGFNKGKTENHHQDNECSKCEK